MLADAAKQSKERVKSHIAVVATEQSRQEVCWTENRERQRETE